VGDVLQGVFHAHRPRGWAPTKKAIPWMLFKTSRGRINNWTQTSQQQTSEPAEQLKSTDISWR
jgi:hypothetical protein